jgi:hypothetical protein
MVFGVFPGSVKGFLESIGVGCGRVGMPTLGAVACCGCSHITLSGQTAAQGAQRVGM